MIGILGVLAAAFFLLRDKKKLQSLEIIFIVLIGLAFILLALSRFFIFNFAYYGYYGLMLISIIGILILGIKNRNNLWISLLASIWMFSFLFAILNLPYHYELLIFKLLVVLPLSIFLLFSKKTIHFDKIWIGLYLIILGFEVYSSYF